MVGSRRSIFLSIVLTFVVLILFWSGRNWFFPSAQTLENDCREAAEQAEWKHLAQISERWSKLEPERAEPWLFCAEAAEGLEDWSRMADCLGRIPKTDRRAIPALARKAGLEFEYLNRPWDGLKTCDEIIDIDPRVLLAHKQSIFFAAMTLQRKDLIRRIRRAIRVRRESPDSYVYLASAHWFYGSSLYRHNSHWLKSNPDDETFQVAQAMQIYMSEAKSNLEEADKYTHIPPPEELLKRYPHNLELLAFFLNNAIEAGDVEYVEELIGAVPKSSADTDARILRAKAWLADSLDDLSAAETYLRRAYSIDPYWWKIHFQLHDTLRRLGQIDEAGLFLKIYDVSLPLSRMIMEMNRSTEALDDANFPKAMLELAELVGDEEVVNSLRLRIMSQQ